MISLGLFLVLIGIIVFSLIFSVLYITPEDKFIKKIVIMGTGPVIYIILLNIYINLFYRIDFELTRAFTNLLVIPILLVLVILIFNPVNKIIRLNVKKNGILMSNDIILPILLAGSIFLFGILFFNP